MRKELLTKSPSLGELYILESNTEIKLPIGSSFSGSASKVVSTRRITGELQYCYVVSVATG